MAASKPPLTLQQTIDCVLAERMFHTKHPETHGKCVPGKCQHRKPYPASDASVCHRNSRKTHVCTAELCEYITPLEGDYSCALTHKIHARALCEKTACRPNTKRSGGGGFDGCGSDEEVGAEGNGFDGFSFRSGIERRIKIFGALHSEVMHNLIARIIAAIFAYVRDHRDHVVAVVATENAEKASSSSSSSLPAHELLRREKETADMEYAQFAPLYADDALVSAAATCFTSIWHCVAAAGEGGGVPLTPNYRKIVIFSLVVFFFFRNGDFLPGIFPLVPAFQFAVSKANIIEAVCRAIGIAKIKSGAITDGQSDYQDRIRKWPHRRQETCAALIRPFLLSRILIRPPTPPSAPS